MLRDLPSQPVGNFLAEGPGVMGRGTVVGGAIKKARIARFGLITQRFSPQNEPLAAERIGKVAPAELASAFQLRN